MIMCKFRQDACDAYCNIAKQHDFCKDEENCPVFKLQEENERLQKVILEQNILNIDLMGENERLEKICDFNCPVHKLATHNACLTCPAVRNSPHHDLKNVSDEELQKIIKDAEAEMEM